MARIHLVEGPVGAGKSTFAAALSRRHAAPHLALDAWMATLFGPDRPNTGVVAWYMERKDRCLEQIWAVARDLVERGGDVVLELGLVQRRSRESLYSRVDAQAYELTVYVLDAPREVRRERVRARNQQKGTTFSMEVPDHVFEIASDMWEPPDDAESRDRGIRFITTHDGGSQQDRANDQV